MQTTIKPQNFDKLSLSAHNVVLSAEFYTNQPSPYSPVRSHTIQSVCKLLSFERAYKYLAMKFIMYFSDLRRFKHPPKTLQIPSYFSIDKEVSYRAMQSIARFH